MLYKQGPSRTSLRGRPNPILASGPPGAIENMFLLSFQILKLVVILRTDGDAIYIGASPGGLPASEASPSRHAEPPPASPR